MGKELDLLLGPAEAGLIRNDGNPPSAICNVSTRSRNRSRRRRMRRRRRRRSAEYHTKKR